MGKSRKEEHKAFFAWLVQTIKEKKIDVLLVAGDIFDTGTPPNYALELYYTLLKNLYSIGGLQIIITAGNHDSVSTLKAPKQLLELMNISVITSGNREENQLIPIYKNHLLQGVVCAVPFLRDSVVRRSVSGEHLSEKESALSLGIKKHYENIYREAVKICKNRDIPIITMGHLTTLGSRTSESERDIYIGGMLDIGGDFLADKFDYVALGHLHINQSVKTDHVRYSGSPIPLSFSESKQRKSVNIVTFNNKNIEVKELAVPLYRKFLVLKGNMETIKKALEQIEEKNAWIEIHLDDKNPMFANTAIREYAEILKLTILAIKIDKSKKNLHAEALNVISLDELTPTEVFNRQLEMDSIEDKAFKKELMLTFQKVVEKVATQ